MMTGEGPTAPTITGDGPALSEEPAAAVLTITGDGPADASEELFESESMSGGDGARLPGDVGAAKRGVRSNDSSSSCARFSATRSGFGWDGGVEGKGGKIQSSPTQKKRAEN